MKKVLSSLTLVAAFGFALQGCTHTPQKVAVEDTASIKRSFASINSMSSAAKYNLFSTQMAQFEAANFEAVQSGVFTDDEGDLDLIAEPSFETPPPVEDVAGVSSISELQQASIDQVKGGGGSWGFEFIYIDPKGKETVLSQYNIHQALTPASTNKLFSGYFSFAKGSYPENNMASMLHVSNNKMADEVLASVANKIQGVPINNMRKFYSGLEDYVKYSPIDGSGLSGKNRVTARLEVSLLKKILKDTKYEKFKSLLGHPGDECAYDIKSFERKDYNGLLHSQKYHSTMSSRLPEYSKRLHAKTGSLPASGVKSLAGFVDVTTPSGNGVIIFSTLANNVWLAKEKRLNAGLIFNKIAAMVKVHTQYVDANLAK